MTEKKDTKRILFDQEWFGKIGIIAHEFGRGYVGIHVMRPKEKCRLYRVAEDEMQDPEFWNKMKERVLNEEFVPPDKGSCPNCGSPLQNWLRRYTFRRFCSFCGERFPDGEA